jgi:predicted ferric reductase
MITLLSPTPTPTFIKVGAPLAPTKTPTPTVKILANASPLIQSSITIQPTITFSSAGNITSFGKLLPNKPTNTNNLAFGTTPNIPTSSSGSELPSWEKTGKISSYLAYIGLGSLFLNFLLISYLIISHLKNKGVQNGFMIDLGRKFISNLGLIVSIILTTIPLFIWYYLDPIATRISSSYMIFTSLGQIFGLGGMVLFALSLIYSARFKFLEKYFGGINVLYKYHHQLGGIAFIFLMLHPLFLAATYAFSSIKSAALFLLPGNDFSINLGILSLMLLMLLLILTFFLKLRYQFWHFTHKFLGLAFFLGGMHAFFVKSDISRDPTLKIYMLIIILSALFCFLYKTVFGRFLIKKLPYAVKEIKPLNSQVYEIVCEPINEKIDFRPGQFVFIGFEDSPLGNEAHPFSISSSPEEQDLRLAIKALGDYTSRLNALTPGTIAKIEGPFGQFSYINAKFKKQIWIAGGIGITPFISMAKSLPDDYEIDLYYTVNEQSEAVYLRDLIDIAAKKPHLLIIPHYSKTQTRLTAEQILEKSRDIFHKDIFLCGPPSMMDGLKKQFVEMRVLQNNIHSEEFAFYA